MDRPIQMVDLKTQYQHISSHVDEAIQEVLSSAQYVRGPQVAKFEKELATYLGVEHVIGCANGTDALQISLMALDLVPGDEVIVPSFTFIATAEVIGLLQLTPVMIDVDPSTFNLRPADVEAAITSKTKAIVPVHLFGQTADMQPILDIAATHNIAVVEDNAQSMGATYKMADGTTVKAGSMGDTGCTSFFPAKNLGCYGDGGAIFTNDADLADKIRMVANHGQSRMYYHDRIGVNSRLDSIQAAILSVKLKHLDAYNAARQKAAKTYDSFLANIEQVVTPARASYASHVFHQYTIQVPAEERDALKAYLASQQIPANIYYPVPMYEQKAFASHRPTKMEPLVHTASLCQRVLSLPMHTELSADQISRVCQAINLFFNK
ncbi:MAG: DegT/DnrJ/EryC1/StrS family aminotransferase [Saprospiraceae bacterium]|nr:DegT/DnrJ/EryC1/StrS family aminotransferase [Saprospiraceae bacterium]